MKNQNQDPEFNSFITLIKELNSLNNQFMSNSIFIEFDGKLYEDLFINELNLNVDNEVELIQFVLSPKGFNSLIDLFVDQFNFKSFQIIEKDLNSLKLSERISSLLYKIKIKIININKLDGTSYIMYVPFK